MVLFRVLSRPRPTLTRDCERGIRRSSSGWRDRVSVQRAHGVLHGAVVVVLTFAVSLGLAAAAGAQSSAESYRLVDGWAQLPEGVEAWGQTIGVEIDSGGDLWVFHRCFDGDCIGRDDVPPVLRYDPSGALVDSWGQGLFAWPHGFFLDDDGNIWTTDARGENGKGHQVLKLSPDGRVLMTLGTAGVAGAAEATFDGPADVVVAPNGDIFVADGHGNNRVVKFSKDGAFLKAWGTKGTGPGQFDEPHCLALDSTGRLFVGDRLNQRIQIFDQDGTYLDEWPGIMASGIDITDDDTVYVADYQLRKGIVIAKTDDFNARGFIAEAQAEGVAVDAAGNVYAGEVTSRNLKKFVRTR